MANFATLCPIIIYLPAIIIVLVAIIVGVAHCIFALPRRRPATPIVVQRRVRVRNGVLSGGVPHGHLGCGINGAVYANNFADLERT